MAVLRPAALFGMLMSFSIVSPCHYVGPAKPADYKYVPGTFLRFGREYKGEEAEHDLSALEAAEGEDYGHEEDKRMQGFDHIRKAPTFVRSSKSDLQQALNPENKRSVRER